MPAGELAIVLHTHMPYVEGLGCDVQAPKGLGDHVGDVSSGER
jgi:hypothetical protein